MDESKRNKTDINSTSTKIYETVKINIQIIIESRNGIQIHYHR